MDKINGHEVVRGALEHGMAQDKEKEIALAILETLCRHKTSVGEAISALHRTESMILQERISLQRNP